MLPFGKEEVGDGDFFLTSVSFAFRGSLMYFYVAIVRLPKKQRSNLKVNEGWDTTVVNQSMREF